LTVLLLKHLASDFVYTWKGKMKSLKFKRGAPLCEILLPESAASYIC